MKLINYILLLILASSCSEEVIDNEKSQNVIAEIKTNDSTKLETSIIDSTNYNKSSNIIVAPIGTQLLNESKRTKYVWEITTYDLLDISFANCESDGEEIYNTKYPIINEVIHNDSILSVDFNFRDECGSDFLCEVELVDNNTLNLIYHQFGAYTSCLCCYGLKYNFNIIIEDQNGSEPNIEFITINGKEKTKI
jgi:hypothetical protein